MADVYVQPKDFPWFNHSDFPCPHLTGDVLLGEQITTMKGSNVHRVEFRDLDHMRSHLDEALPYEEWDREAMLGNDPDWTYDGSSREETIECWEKGIAPSQESRKIYEDMRDSVRAQFVSTDMRKCRAAKRRRVNAWSGGSVNIPKYLDSKESGIPAPVFRTMSKRADRPVIRIGLNTSMGAQQVGEKFAKIAAITACMCSSSSASRMSSPVAVSILLDSLSSSSSWRPNFTSSAMTYTLSAGNLLISASTGFMSLRSIRSEATPRPARIAVSVCAVFLLAAFLYTSLLPTVHSSRASLSMRGWKCVLIPSRQTGPNVTCSKALTKSTRTAADFFPPKHAATSCTDCAQMALAAPFPGAIQL